jgi:hypothetical protein
MIYGLIHMRVWINADPLLEFQLILPSIVQQPGHTPPSWRKGLRKSLGGRGRPVEMCV